jgi:hypothetical protein
MAVVIALTVMTLLASLGTALVMAVMAETQVASSYDRALEASYAADGAAELAIQELAAGPDWTLALDGSVQSGFVDGPPGGVRTLDDGASVDLTRLSNLVRCGRPAPCSDAELNATTQERPWGVNNPRWALFAYGPLNRLLPNDGVRSSLYVVVWVGDDPAERDGRPLVDGGPNVDGSTNDGVDTVTLLVHAYGRAGSRRMIEVTVARAGAGIRQLAWRELRS